MHIKVSFLYLFKYIYGKVDYPCTLLIETSACGFLSLCENQPRKYNYSHEIVINTTGHDLNITSLDEELTEEASCGDLQSEEDL
jgi:hypothetical protein